MRRGDADLFTRENGRFRVFDLMSARQWAFIGVALENELAANGCDRCVGEKGVLRLDDWAAGKRGDNGFR